jgi:arylsulfatase A-like enzyme
MIEHDMQVGNLLRKLDDLGIAENTIVLYTSDNGPHKNSWPDAGISPFRSEKATNWEGAFRVPALVRWPGKIKPGQISNEIVSGLDWLPTFVAAAGDPDIKEKLLEGYTTGNKSFKNHLDGYNLLPYLTGREEKSPRKSFFYFNDDTQLVALRFENWKLVFIEMREQGTAAIWAEPFVELRMPKLFDLRADPFEQADITSNTYWDWVIEHVYLFVPAQKYVGDFLATFKEFPPAQKPASFNLEEVKRKLSDPIPGGQ